MDTQTEVPNWLTIHESNDDPKYPRTKEQRELQVATFEVVFETVLDRIVEGSPVRDVILNDPRGIDLPTFLRWVHSSDKRKARYVEAQELATEIVLEEMQRIADAIDNPLEDVARSKLRCDIRNLKLKAWNRKKFGDAKQIENTGSTGGVTVIIGEVQSPHAKLVSGVTIDG